MNSRRTKKRFSLSNSYFGFILHRHLSDRLLFNFLLVFCITSALFAGIALSTTYTTSVPTQGGTIVEGIVGTPRFVNPVLAINRADHDMVALIYSGLMKINEQGALVNDTAESVTLTDDGLTYHVVLKKGIHFHDGSELKARDVAYTIALIQNPELKSPLRGNWDGVQVEEVNDFELNITLKEAYSPFMENLTIGILPRELWDELPIEQIPFSQNNTEPVGTGPYKVSDVLRSKSGLISGYKLTAFETATYKQNITTLVFNFYQNEDELLIALQKNDIASTPSLSPNQFSKVDLATYQIIQAPLPRTFAIYFNQNKSAALRDKSVREALDVVLNKQALVDKVLYGYGIPTSSPVPPGFLDVESNDSEGEVLSDDVRQRKAESILTAGGWSKSEQGTWQKVIDKTTVTLSVSLDTANAPLFDQTANSIADVWKTLGVEVRIAQFEQNDLVQSVIRTRDFEALLYGADVGRQIDMYPFWHSSQKNDPGLNIAQYTNITVDSLLQSARAQKDETLRTEDIHKIEAIIADEKPAIFLFIPTFGYVLDTTITATPFSDLSKPSERFANISQWHIKSNNVWPLFSNN